MLIANLETTISQIKPILIFLRKNCKTACIHLCWAFFWALLPESNSHQTMKKEGKKRQLSSQPDYTFGNEALQVINLIKMPRRN